jgi:hypothetical protein
MLRRGIFWVQDLCYRFFGLLHGISRFLHRERLIVPLIWIAFLFLFMGIVGTARKGLRVLRDYGLPLCPLAEIVTGEVPTGAECRVAGWAYADVGYERYRETTWLGLTMFRATHESYYLLLDHDTGAGILVRQLGKLAGEPQEPVEMVVAGELLAMEADLAAVLAGDDWDEAQITLPRLVLWGEEARLPLRESFILLLLLLTVTFLIVTPRLDFLLFRPARAEETRDRSDMEAPLSGWQRVARKSQPPPPPTEEIGLWVTTTLPITGARRRVQLVETRAKLQPTAAGWDMVVFHAPTRSKALVVAIRADAIEQLVPGQVYYGWQPKPGLWLLFRDAEGQRRRLCLTFTNRARRREARVMLGDPTLAAEDQLAEQATS